MASTREYNRKNGGKFYRIQVSRGRGKNPATMNWEVPENLLGNAKKVQAELNRQVVAFEKLVESGEYKDRFEIKAEQKQAEIENAKIKTVRQYGDLVFMPNKIKDGIESKTEAYYRNALDNHIYNKIGDFRITEVTSADLKNLMFSLSYSSGKKKGQPLSKSSTRGVFVTLKLLFEMAYLDDTLENNPMGKVRLPKKEKGEIKNEDLEYFSEDELNKILECVNNDFVAAKTDRTKKEALWHRAFVILLAETGCRCAEICGLQWKNVDFKNNSIKIQNNVVYTTEHGLEQTSPKGKRAREIPFSNTKVIEALQDIKEQQRKDGRLSEFCFPQYDLSRPILPSSVNRFMSKIEERYSLDFHPHPHMFRHTLATRLEKNGVDIATISKICGHADVSTTMNMYVHANQEDMREGMKKLDNVVELKSKKAK